MRSSLRHRWRLVALVLIAAQVIGACQFMPGGQQTPPGGPGGPGGVAKPGVAPISVGTSPVIKDILSPTLSYAGNVQARTMVSLVPRISARLEKLYVDVGDEVQAGQVIAELDHLQLDAQVMEAQAGVLAAQVKLEQAQSAAKQEDIDAAQAVVDQSQARLAQARAGGRPEEVAAARAQLGQLEARAEQVSAGARNEEIIALQGAIDQAEAQRDQQRAQLVTAQTQLAESKLRLDQARAGRGGPGVRAEDIAAAEVTLQTNRTKLQQLRNPRTEDLRTAELTVRREQSDLEAAVEARENCGNSSTTTTNRTRTRTNSGTTNQETTTRSEASCSASQRDQLDAAINSARADLQIAQVALEKARNPSPYDLQQAEQAVVQAEAALQKARFGGTSDIASLELKLAQSQGEVDRLQAGLDQSGATISQAQAELEQAINPSVFDIRQANEAAGQARANLARIANPDPFAVEQARAQLDQSVAQLNSRLRPFTEQDIRVAAAGVEQAAASLEIARVQAAEAIIRSPFDAVVSQKLLSPGAMAAPQTPIVTLVSKDIEIVVQVEEARLGQVQRGQPAELTVSAYPGRVFPATVAAVAPSADTRSRTFAVRVVPRDQDGTLRDGMFAQVSISGVGQEALLIPNAAIVSRAGRSSVFVVTNERVQAREVRLGETDGRRTAVLEGNVAAGEEVVVTNPEVLTDGAPVEVEQRNIEPRAAPLTAPTPTSSFGGRSEPIPSPSPQGSSSGQGR